MERHKNKRVFNYLSFLLLAYILVCLGVTRMDQGVHYFEAYHGDSRHHSWTGVRLRLPEKPDHCKWVDKTSKVTIKLHPFTAYLS